MSLRLIPDLTVIRPADGTETAYAWQAALENQSGPTALIFSRQNAVTHAESGAGALRGGYVLRDADGAQVILIGTGTEVQVALDAADLLAEQGIAARVVSMPSWELFDREPQSYRDSVLLPQIAARVSVEAGVTSGWQRYVGVNGRSVGLDQFGSSAPYTKVYEELGLTAEQVAQTAVDLLA